jgi:hypothetical protein
LQAATGVGGQASLAGKMVDFQANLATQLAAFGTAASGPGGVSATQLKQYLILLENPELSDPSYDVMLEAFFKALVDLPVGAKDLLRDWIALNCDAERLQRWLAPVQQYTSIRSVTGDGPGPLSRGMAPEAPGVNLLFRYYNEEYPEVMIAVRVMAILYKANVKSRVLKPPVGECASLWFYS